VYGCDREKEGNGNSKVNNEEKGYL